MHHFVCCYCEHNGFDTIEKSAYHKVKKDHGPFSIYKCIGCDSLITYPLPSEEQLQQLYRSFEDGVDARLTRMRKETPLSEWYRHCVEESTSGIGGSIKWLEAGSGGGELASILAEKFPSGSGIVVDLIPKVEGHFVNVQPVAVDMNQAYWINSLPHQGFDLILCVAVLEHMMQPDQFLDQLIGLLNKKGRLYVVTPDNSSWAAKFFRRRWPYYLPGEHLHIATPRGISKWFQRVQQRTNNSYKARVSRCKIIYPVRYILRFFRLGIIANLFSKRSNIAVKAGLLKLVIERKN